MTPTTAAAMGAVAVDKAGVGLGRAQLVAAGRRLARHRRHGRDRREPGRRDDAAACCGPSSSSTAITSRSTWPAVIALCRRCRWQSSPCASTSTTRRLRRPRCDGHAVATGGDRPPCSDRRCGALGLLGPQLPAARRPPRSRARRASPSRSSTATSARSASSFSPAWTRCGAVCARQSRRRSRREPDPAGWVLAVPRAITSLAARPAARAHSALAAGAERGDRRRGDPAPLPAPPPRGARLRRRTCSAVRRPPAASTRTATSRPRRGSASGVGLLRSVQDRFGGLLGDEEIDAIAAVPRALVDGRRRIRKRRLWHP